MEYIKKVINPYNRYILLGLLAGIPVLGMFFNKKRVIKGKLVIVTGASSGIGKCTTYELAKQGCHLIIIARSIQVLKEMEVEIKEKYNVSVFAIQADLSLESELENVQQSIDEILIENPMLGPIEILINCAGSGKWKFNEETSYKESLEMISLPYLAAFNMSSYVTNKMLRNGSGCIVNINSPVSLIPWQGCAGYASSRFALRGFTECLRNDLHGTGIDVIEVIPGESDSNYFASNQIGRANFPYVASFFPNISPADVGKEIVYAIVNKKKTHIVPLSVRLLLYFTFLKDVFFFKYLFNKLLQTPVGKERSSQIKQFQKEKKIKDQ
ncbi:hypothetical protein CYY_005941 [Polysphondylium violaceum]|uniref:Uncharacterized protein n=1 Tax=Polysphondylium violaceum TaxID=133409 RepID=A0A8J4PR85_9MYCE|nr:hypothetical protein CYY_005941 [Polysphondylium violaceum]